MRSRNNNDKEFPVIPRQTKDSPSDWRFVERGRDRTQATWASWLAVGILLDAAKYKLNSQLSASRCPNGYFKAIDSWNWNAAVAIAAAAAPFKNFDLFSSIGWADFTFTRRFAQAALFRYPAHRYSDTRTHRYTDARRRGSTFLFSFAVPCSFG